MYVKRGDLAINCKSQHQEDPISKQQHRDVWNFCAVFNLQKWRTFQTQQLEYESTLRNIRLFWFISNKKNANKRKPSKIGWHLCVRAKFIVLCVLSQCARIRVCVYGRWVNLEIVIARWARFTHVCAASNNMTATELHIWWWHASATQQIALTNHTHTHHEKPHHSTNIHFVCTLMRTQARNLDFNDAYLPKKNKPE